MSGDQATGRARIQALRGVTFLPGSSDKREISIMATRVRNRPDLALTDRQLRMAEHLAWRYRRQLPAAMCPAAEVDRPARL